MRWGLLAALLFATGFTAAASTAGSPLAKADAAMAQARQDDMPLLAPEAWSKATAAYARAKDAVDRNRAPAQIGKYVDRSRDLPGQHLGPSPVERLDEFSSLRMLSDQEVDALAPRSPRVLACVPFRRGHLGKKRIHLVRVIEQVAVEVTRVPIDEDAAQVEDHGGRAYRGDRAHSFSGVNITIGISLAVRSW